jgi:hypothetical protein
MATLDSPQNDPDRRGWVVAIALALALHVGAVILLYCLPLAAASPTESRNPVTVRLFAPPTEAREPNQPHYFTELPPDRADVAPKKPDFLSNVNSQARDRVGGGKDDLPQMHGIADAPMVKLEKNSNPSSAKSAPGPEKVAQSEKSTQDGTQKQRQTDPDGPLSLAKPIEPQVFGQRSNDALRRMVASGGVGSDIDQPEMDKPDGNASLIGDVSLSTIAWDYAPWLQDFERKIYRYWFAPPAYSIGLLKEGGWGMFQLRVSRSGKVLSLELLGQQGHPSLIRCAQAALSNVSPLEALPSEFPDSTLVVRVRMTYPRIPSR